MIAKVITPCMSYTAAPLLLQKKGLSKLCYKLTEKKITKVEDSKYNMVRNELYIWKLHVIATIISSYILDQRCSDVLVLKYETIAINMLSVFMEALENNLFFTYQR